MIKNTNKINSYLLNNKELLLLLIFIFSRIYFINPFGVFFDSNEYLDILSNSNFITSLFIGHFPPHEGYILIFWPIYQFAQFLKINPSYIVIYEQILLSTIIIYCFYKITSYISSKSIALIASILISITPLFWIANVSYMVEISYVFFYISSLYLSILYLKKNKIYYLYISSIFLTLSFITYSAVLLWMPVYLSIIYFKNKEKLIKISIILFIFSFIFSFLRVILISSIIHKTFQGTFYDLYISKTTQVNIVQYNLQEILILIRNFIPLLRNYTPVVIIISFISLIISFFKNKKYFTVWTSMGITCCIR